MNTGVLAVGHNKPTTQEMQDAAKQHEAGRAGSERGTMEFLYPRAKGAIADGIVFTVEWSDDLTMSNWSSVGVSEEMLARTAPPSNERQPFPRAVAVIDSCV
jgi:hypothetical protein